MMAGHDVAPKQNGHAKGPGRRSPTARARGASKKPYSSAAEALQAATVQAWQDVNKPDANGVEIRDRYRFEQTASIVIVKVPIPGSARKKMLEVIVGETGLYVGVRGEQAPRLAGPFFQRIDRHSAKFEWNIAPGSHDVERFVELRLPKCDEGVNWPVLIVPLSPDAPMTSGVSGKGANGDTSADPESGLQTSVKKQGDSAGMRRYADEPSAWPVDMHSMLFHAKRLDTDGHGDLVMQYLKSATARGSVEAPLQLMQWYQQGKEGGYPIDRNLEEAFRLAELAANRGSGEGEYTLGRLYEQGLGTKVDVVKAADWYQKTTAHYNPFTGRAAFALAAMLYRSAHAMKDDAQRSSLEGMAMQWWTVAATLGHAGAHYNLGIMYMNDGAGVGADAGKAALHFATAKKLDPRIEVPQIVNGQMIVPQKTESPVMATSSTADGQPTGPSTQSTATKEAEGHVSSAVDQSAEAIPASVAAAATPSEGRGSRREWLKLAFTMAAVVGAFALHRVLKRH